MRTDAVFTSDHDLDGVWRANKDKGFHGGVRITCYYIRANKSHVLPQMEHCCRFTSFVTPILTASLLQVMLLVEVF